MGIFGGIFKSQNEKELIELKKTADKVVALADKYASMSDSELKDQTAVLKQRLANGETTDDILPDAFAVVREAGARVLNMRHFYVQIIGGIVLHQGRIAQMNTGEGKTLVATLPAYLNALTGKGVHVVTVNDYLAQRDAEWMGKIYKFLGLTVGVILHNQTRQAKKHAYRCDITYGTNNEFGFDYLRDNMATNQNDVVMRDLEYVLIDEVDSILVDEARTPLIISGRGNKSSEMYVSANKFAKSLAPVDYEVDEKDKAVRLNDSGVMKAEKFFNVDNLADIDNSELNHYILQAIKANFIMKRDSDYIVENGEIMIVDEFTGRKMEGRRYSQGLHQAIEAKEGLRIKEESKTLATITFQNLFRLYKKLSGMTGTAKTEEAEFNSIYKLDVVEIPTNRPVARIDYNDVIFKTEKGKLKAIVEDVAERHKSGQPMLIGTLTVEKSEELSKLLSAKGIRHNVLNAKNHEREAEIVAQAGRIGSVTIATNMAGRGTDILLGGNPEFLAKKEMAALGFSDELIDSALSYKADKTAEEIAATKKYQELYNKHKSQTDAEREKVLATGGLHIIGTERHESRRIDNQLRGRAGRQGDPGSSVFFISLEDDMARIFGGEKMQKFFNLLKVEEDMPIEAKVITKQIERAQERIEDRNFSSRKHVLQYDDVMNEQRKLIYNERNKVLGGADIHEDIKGMVKAVIDNVLANHIDLNRSTQDWEFEDLNEVLCKDFFNTNDAYIEHEWIDKITGAEFRDKLVADLIEILDNKIEENAQKEIDFKEVERFIMLKVVDEKWMAHIDAMDELRRGIGLMAYGNHNPVEAYKNEGFDMFDKMIKEIQYDTVKFCLRVNVRRVLIDNSNGPRKVDPSVNPNLNRNGPCPCGSGKKYKHCCGKGEQQ
ncbi:MAG: preprotein translocase subunit SecA [Clostridiales bacterium]|nr:preprotein translocase subunit SecA [Clostridiales bacterium]